MYFDDKTPRYACGIAICNENINTTSYHNHVVKIMHYKKRTGYHRIQMKCAEVWCLSVAFQK